MQNQCYLNVRSKCILNALRIHKGMSKFSYLSIGEYRKDGYLKISDFLNEFPYLTTL